MVSVTGQLNQQNTSYVSGGTTYYRTYNLVLNVVNIEAQVFLYKIIDATNSALDTFERICTPADMGAWYNTRAAAVSNGDSYWRDEALTRDYVSLETARDAATVITETVSQLFTDYATYLTDFAGASSITLPDPTTTILQSLIDTAEATNDLYEAAQVAEAAALVDKTTAENYHTFLSGHYTSLDSIYVKVSNANTSMLNYSLHEALATAEGTSASINSSEPTFWGHYTDLVEDADAGKSTISDARSDLGSLRSTISASLTSALADVNSTTAAYVAAAANTSALLAQRTTEANVVYAIDPTYTFTWE